MVKLYDARAVTSKKLAYLAFMHNFALKHSCKMTPMMGYFHDLWKTSTFLYAYSEKAETYLMPIVLNDYLTRGLCYSPSISKKWGRPKKKGISSQQATAEIDKRQTRNFCICNQFGHNRRTFTTKKEQYSMFKCTYHIIHREQKFPIPHIVFFAL